MNTADSSALIEKCLAGDEQAVEMFIHAYEADVFRLALSMVNDSFVAAEIAQETFLSALRSLRNYREESSLKAWLFTITLNASRSYLRKQKVLQKLRDSLGALLRLDSQKSISPEDRTILNEKEKAVWDALNELDEGFRTVIILRYFQNLPVAEIAEILSIPEGTVHSRLHTARERLRNVLEPLRGE